MIRPLLAALLLPAAPVIASPPVACENRRTVGPAI